jgi:hypothetical protein
MRSTMSLAVRRRPALFGLMLAVALLALFVGPSYGQTTQAAPPPAAQAAPAQPQTPPPGRIFGSDAGLIFNTIKPDKTADFEMIIGKLKAALAKSTDPVRKQQAASWKVFKSVDPGPAGNVLYIFVVDPAVKGADYTVSKILAEGFPAEVQDLFKTFSAAYGGGQNLVNLQLVADLGKQ